MKEREPAAVYGNGRAGVRDDRGRPPAWCEGCGAQVQMLTAFAAAVVAGVSSYTVYRWAEQGAIHHSVTAEGVLLVCPHSLAQRGKD